MSFIRSAVAENDDDDDDDDGTFIPLLFLDRNSLYHEFVFVILNCMDYQVLV